MKSVIQFFAMLGCALTLPASSVAQLPAAREVAEDQGKPVAAFWMRASVVPRAGDEEPLKQGMALMIGSSAGGMTIVEYRLVNGKIVWKPTSGSVDAKTHKAIDKAVAKLQKRL